MKLIRKGGNGLAVKASKSASKIITDIVDLARSGNKEALARLTSFGLNWGTPGVYRYISEGELNDILSGRTYMGRFGNGRVDVTGSLVPSTGASNQYRITFNPKHDLYKMSSDANRARMKNAALKDGWIFGGYSIDDIDFVEQLMEDGTYKKISLPELDWSPKSWFGKRPVGAGPYTQEEVEELASNVPEYLAIERKAKQNGTWLKLPDGSLWEGDPREWVMMLSKKYKDFIKDSKLLGNYTHESNNWVGTEIVPQPVKAGKLFGDGFYLFKNPTGKDTTIRKIYTLAVNRKNPPTPYNIAVRSLTPAVYDPKKDGHADIWITDRNSPERVGTFHNPNYKLVEVFDPRLDNDALILDGAWKGRDKVVVGFPGGPYAAPDIKFVVGNTGNFSLDPKFRRNVFKGLGYGLGTSILYNSLNTNK